MANHQDFNLELRQAVIPTDEALSGMEVAETVSPIIEEETSFWLKNVNLVIPETDPGDEDPGDEDPEVPGTISVDPESLEFSSEGEQKEVTVTASGEYEIKSKPDWITGDFVGNTGTLTTVILTATANDTGEYRMGYVEFALTSNPAVKAILVVGQLTAVAGTISIYPETMGFEAAGGTKLVTVTASSAYEIASKPDWITGQLAENTATLTATANGTGADRTANVVFKLTAEPTVTATLAVTQLKE